MITEYRLRILTRIRTALVVATVALTAGTVVAQVQQATLEGRVTDSTGSPLPGVTLSVRDPKTNQTRVGSSDDQGQFRLSSLPPSLYELRADLSGLQPYERHELLLPVGRTIRLSIVLSAPSVTETVEVTAQSSALNTSETAASTIIDTERIEELPVQSRNYLDFVLLAPGVVSTKQRAGTPVRSGLTDSGFSFSGLRPRSNSLTIDGLDNNDEFSGSSRTELSLETIQEFEVVNHSWSVENGGGSAGSINVVTKSGANVIHGDAFIFGQSGRFNARPALESADGEKPDLKRYRGGFAFGGPIVPARSFFYVAGEKEHTSGQEASDIDRVDSAAINRAIDAGVGLRPGVRLTEGLFPTRLNETELSAKLGHHATPTQSVVARIASTDNQEEGDAFNTGGLVDFSSRGSNATRDLATTGSWMSILGESITNDLRGQLARRNVELATRESQGSAIVIAGLAEFGRAYEGQSRHHQRYLELDDTLSYGSGHHFLKAGVSMNSVHVTGQTRDGSGGIYLFRSVDQFAAQQPESFRQGFADPRVDIQATRYGLFLQDDWTPLASLTVIGGLRLDGEALPARLGITNRQLSPRIGVSWTPSPFWVVRGGAGTFADRVPLAALERALTIDGTRGFEQILDGPQAAALFVNNAGGASTSPVGEVSPSIYTVQRGRWSSSSRQASIGVERLITSNLTISANYLYARGHDLLRTVNVNLLPPVILTAENAAALGVKNPTPQQLGRPVFGPGRIDPMRRDIFELQPAASSTYNGLTLTANRRLAQEVEWSVSYTLSRAIDTASDFDEQPENPYVLAAERGPSRYDQRHRLTTSALFELGDTDDRVVGTQPTLWSAIFGHVEIAPILTIESGRPANAVTGLDDNRSHAFNSRPLGSGRNSLRLPSSASLNLRVLKYFPVQPHGKLDLVIEAFNLLNHRNVSEVNPVSGSSANSSGNLGRPISASAGRQIECSLDFEF